MSRLIFGIVTVDREAAELSTGEKWREPFSYCFIELMGLSIKWEIR